MNTPRSTGKPPWSPSRTRPENSGEISNVPRQPLDTGGRPGTSQSTTAQANEIADSLSASVMDAAKTAARAAQEQASEFASGIGEELSKVADDQKKHGVEAMHAFAGALQTAASELEGQSPRFAHYARDAAEKIDELSDNISGRNITELSRAASELARSQPLMFFAGSVAAGFALARFLKSSSRNIPHQPSGPVFHQPSGPAVPVRS